MKWKCPGYLAVCMAVIVVTLTPAPVLGSWNEVNETLREAFGAQEARECQDYYSSLTIPSDQVDTVREAVVKLVTAGYPSGCPKEFLRLVSELSGAGIQLNDLTNKITEGIAKKVSPERLTAVITYRAEALMEARVLTLELIEEGTEFLDRQMTYTVIADYLLRGVDSADLKAGVTGENMEKFPALENLIR